MEGILKVLVTGATGFVGTWLVKRLCTDGHQVRILKRSGTALDDLSLLPIEVLQGDVTDRESLNQACAGVDTVFHLAGLIAYSKAQLAAMEAVNVGGTANVIAACASSRVRKLIYLSSVVAIGASFDGAHILNENSSYKIAHLHLGYFQTKHRAEQLVHAATLKGEVDAIMINPSTIYGPGDAKKGSRGVQLKVARGSFPFYTSGGVNVVSIEDVIDCIIAAWTKGRTGERYIVAGENLLVHQVFSMIAKEAGVKPPSIYLPNPAVRLIGKVGDTLEAIGRKGPLNSENAWASILFHWFDSAKAQRELGLRPKPASYAIAQSLNWSRQHGLLS
jgi:dihydroflavonol-4-reductase